MIALIINNLANKEKKSKYNEQPLRTNVTGIKGFYVPESWPPQYFSIFRLKRPEKTPLAYNFSPQLLIPNSAVVRRYSHLIVTANPP